MCTFFASIQKLRRNEAFCAPSAGHPWNCTFFGHFRFSRHFFPPPYPSLRFFFIQFFFYTLGPFPKIRLLISDQNTAPLRAGTTHTKHKRGPGKQISRGRNEKRTASRCRCRGVKELGRAVHRHLNVAWRRAWCDAALTWPRAPPTTPPACPGDPQARTSLSASSSLRSSLRSSGW